MSFSEAAYARDERRQERILALADRYRSLTLGLDEFLAGDHWRAGALIPEARKAKRTALAEQMAEAALRIWFASEGRDCTLEEVWEATGVWPWRGALPMTHPEASKLKAGDVVTVRATVLADSESAGDGMVLLRVRDHDDPPAPVDFYLPVADILTIEPRPVEVGDRVRCSGGEGEAIVLWTDGAFALVRVADTDPSFAPMLFNISRLTPESERPPEGKTK